MNEQEDEQLPVVTAEAEIVESEEDDPALDSILSALDLPRDTFKDYNTARDTLVTALETGRIAMADMLQLAQAMDHPRAYEVFATVMKSTAEVAEKLMLHQEKIRELTGKKNEAPKTQTTNNILFTGSTKQLQQLLKGKMDEIDVTVEVDTDE
jgi:hypothetical protein